MKKLLSLLGAVTVSASTATAVVACSPSIKGSDSDIFNADSDQDAISKLLSQYAKTLYLNQNALSTDSKTHYSSSSYLKNNVQSQYLGKLGLTDFDSSLGVVSTTTFNDLALNYFNADSLISADVSLSTNLYSGEVLDPEIGEDALVGALKETVPMILGMLANPTQLIQLLPAVSTLLTDELLTTLKTVLTTANLKLLESALGADVYAGMDYQTSLNSSVIGLSNALDKMLNGSSATALKYSSQTEVDANIATANTTLAANAYSLISGEKSLQIDLLSNIDSIAEIVRFVRTLLVYIDQFTLDEMSADVLTMEEIETKRATTFDASKNSVDVKLAFQKLAALTSDADGTVMKNYLGILLLTNSTDFNLIGDYTGTDNSGLMGVVSEIAKKAIGDELVVVEGILTIKTNALVRSFINAGVNSSYGGTLWSTAMLAIPGYISSLPSPIKEIFEAINNDNWTSFSNDWVGYLWTNSNEELNFNLKDLLTTPVDEIDLSGITGLFGGASTLAASSATFDQPKTLSSYYLNGKSIKDVVDQFNTAFASVSASTINFTDFADLFALLAKDDLLQNALAGDKTKLMTALGLNADNTFVAGSPLEKLFAILDDFKEISAQLNAVITVWNTESNKLISSLKAEAKKIFEESTVEITKNDINDFSFKVTYGTVSNTFNIKASVVSSKLVINTISLT